MRCGGRGGGRDSVERPFNRMGVGGSFIKNRRIKRRGMVVWIFRAGKKF